MSRGVDILIATPGRLLDLMNDGHVLFEQLEVFVLDEADRMLDMGFFKDVQRIISKLPEKKQTLLFSATMPKDISILANSLLKDPVRVEVTPQATTVEKIDQKVNFVEKSNKPLLLKSILKDRSLKSVLIFTRTKYGADRVVRYLDKESITAAAIHGNKSQGARERGLGDFRAGKIRVLVATDIASRGIDIPHVSHVINYNIPDDPKSYVHRIGRTARAGREGIAISFCDESEVKLLKDIEKLIKCEIPVDKTPPDLKANFKISSFNETPAQKRSKQASSRSSGRNVRRAANKSGNQRRNSGQIKSDNPN
jgi:ATP-dependent RNA helicase RhlE